MKKFSIFIKRSSAFLVGGALVLGAVFSGNASLCRVLADEPSNVHSKQDSEEEPISGGEAITFHSDDVGYASILYNAENGLPTSEANTVFSSSDGFIWIGGYSGLVRYDGNTFERQDSYEGVTSVNAIFEDSKNRLWIGTNDNGVVCIFKDHSEHFSYNNGLDSTSVNDIAEDDKGNVIIATKQGVFYFDESMNIGEINDSQIKNTYVSIIKKTSDGSICGVTKNGEIFRIKDLRVTNYYNYEDIGVDKITAILPAPDNADEIMFGTNSGLFCRGSFSDSFENIKSTPIYYTHYESDEDSSENDSETGAKSGERLIASEPVSSLSYAADSVWVIMDSRVFFLNEADEFEQLENIPLDGGIEKMDEDFEGNLWFASRRQGVMKIAANKFFDLNAHSKLENRIVNTTYMQDGMFYIGTDTGLQLTDSNYVPVTNSLTKYIGDSRIRCISGDDNGNVWISTYTNNLGLVCYTKGKKIKSYTEESGLPSNSVRCTVPAPDGALLAATNGGLAIIKNGRITRTIDGKKGLNNTVILTVEATSDGKYYLGTDGDGIYVSDGNNLTHLSREDGLTSDVILRIKKDEERNVIWIITSNSIEYIKDGEIHAVQAFPYTNNYDIYFDKSGNAWVLASNGIYVASAQDMIDKESYDYVFYNISNGLASVPTANSFSYLDENGDLYISGREGVSRVNIDSYFQESHDIRFSVLYIEDDENRYYPDENSEFTLPASARNITIHGYALTYMMHDPQIEYCLVGSDSKPITVNKSDMAPVRYTNIRGGNYEYQLSLIDGSTHTVKQTVSFRITKKKAFFEELWFYIICAGIIMLLIAFFIRLYIRRKTAIFRQKEEEQKKLRRLFEQTATALVNAIDAKDKYTHGHSSRVAEYSKMLAGLLGKSEQECDQIYYAALLHDVGKIGVPASIINKNGKLNDEEYDIIKTHPTMGAQILQSIHEYPYLSLGAHYHHERYDGNGYPQHLSGDDIPEIARIISVADAYDAMTSKRSYRDPIPQQKVREEFVKGRGVQFDPEVADLMIRLIDQDTNYDMREKD